MKKRIIALVMCVFFVALLAGCGGAADPLQTMTPKDVLKKSFELSSAQETSKFKITLSTQVNKLESSDPQAATMKAFLNSLKGSIEGSGDTKGEKAFISASLDAIVDNQQKHIDAKIFSDGKQLIVNLPIIKEFIPDKSKYRDYYIIDQKAMNQDPQMQMSGADNMINPQSAQYKALSAYMSQAYVDIIPDTAVTDNGIQQADTADGKVKVRSIDLTLAKADLAAVITKTIALYSDPKYIELYTAYIKSNDKTVTDAKIKEDIAKAKDEMVKFQTDSLPGIQDTSQLTMKILIDDSFNMIKNDIVCSIKAAEQGTAMDLVVMIGVEQSDFNKPVNIQFPQLTLQNSANASNMMN